MMDIEDAVAKDATVQSMAADQATTKMPPDSPEDRG
jgi:hypothetical protein